MVEKGQCISSERLVSFSPWQEIKYQVKLLLETFLGPEESGHIVNTEKDTCLCINRCDHVSQSPEKCYSYHRA